MRTLIIAEHDGPKLNPALSSLVGCALQLRTAGIDIALLSCDAGAASREAAAIEGVDRVIVIERDENAHPLAAILAPQIAALANGYSHLLGPSSTFGKDLMPRVAALCGVGQLSDIIAVESAFRFRRPTYAGNAIVTVDASPDALFVATVRANAFPAAGPGGNASIERAQLDVELPDHTRFIDRSCSDAAGPELQSAERVVSGGRGLGSAGQFALVRELAQALGAATGATRAAVDAGFAPNELQVGQTGKIIAPQLYIALGISGAIQHLTGIKDAGTIVAINKDADAAIFEVADLGLVADLFDAVPQIMAALKRGD